MNIIELLSGEKYVSGNEIGRALGISRAAVHKRVQTLIKSGCIIESSPKGYRIIKKADIFSSKEVFDRLGKTISVCKKIYHFRQTGSTQIKLKKLALKNAVEGSIVVADSQISAYGRMQRNWSSLPGGLWFSVLLKPKILPEHASKLALIISISLSRTLEKYYKVQTSIKWPNDLLYGDKKLSGTVIEMSAEQDSVNWVVAGIGINVNNVLPKDLPDAISLLEILNNDTGRAELLSCILKDFDDIYQQFQQSGFSQFIGEFNSKIAFMGEAVTIDNGFDIIKGMNKGIDETGRILIETADSVRKIASGTLRKF